MVFSNKSGKFLSTPEDNSGYKRVNLYVDGVVVKKLVHRLVAEAFIPKISGLDYVNHKDGDKMNNVVSNLEWCTSSFNQHHAYDNGLKNLPKGEMNGNAKLEESQVLEIYEKLLKGFSVVSLSEMYGVGTTAISDIKSRKSWSHILKDLPAIPVKIKPTRLNEDYVIKVCEQLEKKVPHLEIVEMFNGVVTINQVRDISRRRCFRELSKAYNW